MKGFWLVFYIATSKALPSEWSEEISKSMEQLLSDYGEYPHKLEYGPDPIFEMVNEDSEDFLGPPGEFSDNYEYGDIGGSISGRTGSRFSAVPVDESFVSSTIKPIIKKIAEKLPASYDMNNLHNDLAYDCELSGLDGSLSLEGVKKYADLDHTYSVVVDIYKVVATCNWKKKILFWYKYGTIAGEFIRIKMRMMLQFDSYGKLIYLKDIEQPEITGPLSVDVHGAYFLNWVAERMMTYIFETEFAKGEIASAATRAMKSVINN